MFKIQETDDFFFQAYGGKKAVCKCPDGKVLGEDKHNCVSVINKDMKGWTKDRYIVEQLAPRASSTGKIWLG
jgi:hypothetical protein